MYTASIKVSRLGGKTSSLLVTSSISWDEQDRDALDLSKISLENRSPHQTYFWVFIKALLPNQMQRILRGEASMLSVEVPELREDDLSCIAHVTSLGINLSAQEGMDD